jgi:hypothetical protein
MAGIGGRLLKRDGAIWSFYSKQNVEDLLRQLSSAGSR